MKRVVEVARVPLVDCTDYTHFLAEKYKIQSNKDVRGVYILQYCHDQNYQNLYRIGSGRFKIRLLEHLKIARNLGIHRQVYISSVIVLENLAEQTKLEKKMHDKAKPYRVNQYYLESKTHYHNEFFALTDRIYRELLRNELFDL